MRSFDGQSVLSGLGHCVLFCYAYNSTKEPWQQTSRPSFFNFGPLVVWWSLPLVLLLVQSYKGAKAADQQTSIFQFWASVGLLVPVSCFYYNSSTRQRQGPADQQRPKIEKCWSAGLLPWLPCTTVIVITQETRTSRPAEAQN